jgi:hypothetical protein
LGYLQQIALVEQEDDYSHDKKQNVEKDSIFSMVVQILSFDHVNVECKVEQRLRHAEE